MERIANAEREIRRLRKELLYQWELNHHERCGVPLNRRRAHCPGYSRGEMGNRSGGRARVRIIQRLPEALDCFADVAFTYCLAGLFYAYRQRCDVLSCLETC